MGNQIVNKNAETFLIRDFPELTFEEMLKDRKLMKTTRCTLEGEGPVVVKIYFHRDGMRPQQLQHHEDFLNNIRLKFQGLPHPNVMPYECVCNHDSGAVLVRQYFHSKLSDRLKGIQAPTFVEKLWLSFQILTGVMQIHSEGITHGDIKPENVMLTSSGQVYLTDFASFKPTYISSDSLNEYTLFFTEQTKKCYLAPERLVSEHMAGDRLPVPSMDIFSAGCVIAEIFMNGTPLFDLSALQNYRKGKFNPQKFLELKLKHLKCNKNLITLLMQMIHIDPQQRGQISEIFEKFNALIFPPALSGFVFQLNSALMLPQFALSDERVLLLRYHFDLIWKSCFNSVVPLLHHAGSHVVYETMRFIIDPLLTLHLIPSNFQKFYTIEDSQTVVLDSVINEKFKEAKERTDIDWKSEEVAVIIVDWITSTLQNSLHASSRLSALQMLTAIATHPECSDYLRFQRILPFVLSTFEDQQPKVRAFAVQMSIDIVSSYKRDSLLSPTDLKIFENYIWPFYQTLMTQSHSSESALIENELVRIIVLRNLPKLIKTAEKFMEMSVISRIELKRAQSLGPRGTSIESQSSLTSLWLQPRATEKSLSNEVVQTYDDVKEELRREIKNFLEQTFSIFHEGSLQALIQVELIKVLPQIGVFLGHQKLNNVVIPLILTSFNKTNFMRKLACIEIVTSLGLLVGQATLDQYILPCLEFVLYETNESLVYQTLATYTELAKLGLMNRAKELETLDHLIPFLLHPNHWVRSQMKKFVYTLFESYSLAQQFCHLRPRLSAVTYEPIVLLNKALEPLPLGPQKQETMFDFYLLPALTRHEFANGILNKQTQPVMSPLINKICTYSKAAMERSKNQNFHGKYLEELHKCNLKLAPLSITTEILAQMQTGVLGQYQFDDEDKKTEMQEQESEEDEDPFEEEKDEQLMEGFTNEFVTTAPQRSQRPKKNHKYSEEALLNDMLLETESFMTESDFMSLETEDKRRSSILKSNMGLNRGNVMNPVVVGKKRAKKLRKEMKKIREQRKKTEKLSQFDSDQLFIQQALGLSPLADTMVRSSLHGTRLDDLEKADLTVKTLQLQKLEQLQIRDDPPSLDSIYQHQQPWHPNGAIVNTLIEHRSAVNTLATSSDQRHFASGSADGAVKIWSVAALENDNRVMKGATISLNQKVRNLSFFHNCMSLAIACDKGTLHVYNCGVGSTTLSTKELAFVNRNYMEKGGERSYSVSDDFTLLRKYQYEGEGDMALCHTFAPRSVAGNTSVFCMTQNGTARLLDLRMKNEACEIKVGPEHGIPSALCTDRYENVVFVGTLGGYVQIFDLRFHLVDQFFHWGRSEPSRPEAVPIFSLASFQPDHTQILKLVGSNPSDLTGNFCENTPLLFVGRGASNAHEIALINMNTLHPEVFMTAPLRNRSQSAMNAQVSDPPILVRQPCRTDYINKYLLTKYVKQQIQSSFHQVEQIMDHDKQFNVSDEWLSNSKLRYGALKSALRSNTAVRSLLVPSFACTSSGSLISQPSLISAGSDSTIRFWDLQRDTISNRSFHLNSPELNDPGFQVSFFGDMYVITERDRAAAGMSLTKGNQILGGLSEAQGTNGTTSSEYFAYNNPTQARKQQLQNVSHKDAVLSMTMVAGPRGAPLLVTGGRDSLIKLWS